MDEILPDSVNENTPLKSPLNLKCEERKVNMEKEDLGLQNQSLNNNSSIFGKHMQVSLKLWKLFLGLNTRDSGI